MESILTTLVFLFLLTSCSLTSHTVIRPNEQFVLGNNKHGQFKARLKNVSKQNLEVYQTPIGGGKHSGQTVKPNKSVTVKVDFNTALIINNTSKDTAAVDLKVTGDTGLSMGYNK